MKRILLVDPPMQKFMNFSKAGIPLGLLYLAGEAKRAGHEVLTWDADYNPMGISMPFVEKLHHYDQYLQALNGQPHQIWDKAVSLAEDFKPDVVGISAISTKFASALKLARIYKEMGIPRVIVGGPHATLSPQEVVESQYVDAAVVGEGEVSFHKALKENGIIYGERIKNLDSLANPAIETLVDFDKYHSRDLGMIMTSRGCPEACNFCCSRSLWGKGVTSRSLENVANEVRDLAKNHNVTNFYPVDDTFTYSKRRVIEFSKLMSQLGASWSCLTRVDRIDDETIKAMKSSNCETVKVGLESGSPRILEHMNKKINLQHVENAGKLFNDNLLPWLAYVIIGSPTETVNDMEMTQRFIEKVKPTFVSVANFTPYPGTPFYEELGLGRIPYQLFNHHSIHSINEEGLPVEKRMEFFKWADAWNEKAKNK